MNNHVFEGVIKVRIIISVNSSIPYIQVMCVDWGEKGVVASGGADNDMKLFKSNC